MIGGTITAAADQSPVIMGFLLGGIMKMICTSPLSSMALTAMLGLTGLPMGIAAIACFGGSFTNGMVFHKMGYGDKSNVIAVMLEPLTQHTSLLHIQSRSSFRTSLAAVWQVWQLQCWALSTTLLVLLLQSRV